MKYIILFLTSILLLQTVHSQTHDFEWAKKLGGTSGEFGFSIDVDDSGNVYTLGNFDDVVDFDPSSSTYNLTPAGDLDVFISKLDASGKFVWAKKLGGKKLDHSYSIAVDDSSNVYTIGSFEDTVDFDPGPGVYNLIAASWSDIFISKLDAAGNFVWAKRIGGSSRDTGNGVELDDSGNVYISGTFSGIVDFDPDTGIHNLSSAGSNNIYIAKLNAFGSLLWAKKMGGNYSFFINVDDSNNVYITGKFQGTVDFDPGNNSLNLTSSGVYDAYVTKLDGNGNLIWAKKIGGTGEDQGNSIAIDEYGNVYIAGDFSASVDFNPGGGVFNMTSSGGSDIFILKLSENGNFLWAKRMGGTTVDQGLSIAAYDSAVYTTGHYNGTVDFNPNAGIFNLNGSYNIFISKINYSGKFHWAKQMGPGSYDSGNSIALGDSGNIYVTGNFQSTIDFDPGNGISNLTSTSGHDAFVQRLTRCYTKNAISVNACDSYTVPSLDEIHTSSGIYMDTIPNSEGCDSILTINLKINKSTSSLSNIPACDNYKWQGKNFTTSGSYRDTIQNVLGCDSLMTLNLTIHNSTNASSTVSACGSYHWNGRNLTVNGTYRDTIRNAQGCDSVMTLNLTVITVDTSVTRNSFTLTSNALNSKYQWLDCNNGMRAIAGDTNQSFTASINGSYAVSVSRNSCTDTSACYEILNVGILENTFSNAPLVFPNPNNGQFSLTFDKTVTNLSIRLLNMEGKVIVEKTALKGELFNLNITDQAKGIYLLELVENNQLLRMKVLKK